MTNINSEQRKTEAQARDAITEMASQTKALKLQLYTQLYAMHYEEAYIAYMESGSYLEPDGLTIDDYMPENDEIQFEVNCIMNELQILITHTTKGTPK